LKTSARLPVLKACTGDEAEVVHIGQTTGMLGAAGKSRFKFATKVLRVLMPQQEVRQGMGIGRDVKPLIVADTGQRAPGNVADHVATGLQGGDADRRQAAHEVWGILNVDEV
jgi:hypothetical protein